MLRRGIIPLRRPAGFCRHFQSKAYPHIYLQKSPRDLSRATLCFIDASPAPEVGVIGTAPLNGRGDDVDLSPRSFTPSSAFGEWLNDLMVQHAHVDPVLQAMAAAQSDGHLHIADEKNPPPFGRIPYPEDIIGTLRISHGKLVPGSFTPMKEAYRTVSANGVVKLSEYMEGVAKRELNKLAY